MQRFPAMFLWIPFLCMLLAPVAQADGLNYSYLDLAGFQANPQTGDAGHGGHLSLDYALSNNAFLYAGVSQYDFSSFMARRYNAGVGINSDPGAGYSVFVTVGWNHIGLDPGANASAAVVSGFNAPSGTSGSYAQGYDAAIGMRALVKPGWEIYGLARVTHNPELAKPVSAEFGVLYALSTHLNLGAGVNVNARESDYLLMLRVYY